MAAAAAAYGKATVRARAGAAGFETLTTCSPVNLAATAASPRASSTATAVLVPGRASWPTRVGWVNRLALTTARPPVPAAT